MRTLVQEERANALPVTRVLVTCEQRREGDRGTGGEQRALLGREIFLKFFRIVGGERQPELPFTAALGRRGVMGKCRYQTRRDASKVNRCFHRERDAAPTPKMGAIFFAEQQKKGDVKRGEIADEGACPVPIEGVENSKEAFVRDPRSAKENAVLGTAKQA